MPNPDATPRWLKRCFTKVPGLRTAALFATLLVASLASCVSPQAPKDFPEIAPGVSYTNQREPRMPWSTHVVRVDRAQPDLQFRSWHAHGYALGLATLGEMVEDQEPQAGTPLVAVNGDFFQLPSKAHPGDPRGLQIVDGELISAPGGGASFWLDARGQPHTANVGSAFQVTWPDGTQVPLGLNETRKTNGVVLFTPGAGWSTLTSNSRELVLEPAGDGTWLPLRVGDKIRARVREVRARGNTPLQPNLMVLSIHQRWSPNLAEVKPGEVLTFALNTEPDLRGVQTALSGGPVLVRDFIPQPLPKAEKDKSGKPPSPAIRTMRERHPRTAIGWNNRYFYLVTVDGRQPRLSVGMTLKELAGYLISLGCREAMNLDGGGSAMRWVGDGVVNSPSDGGERAVANALILLRK